MLGALSNVRRPVIYRRSRAAAVFYAVASETAESLLSGTELHAVKLAGHGIVNATWFDYGESSIGPYREFSLGVVACRERLRLSAIGHLLAGRSLAMGAFVLALPVDSATACLGGVKLYGLPKTQLEFDLEWQSGHLTATLLDQGRRILSMQLRLGRGIPFWVRQLLVYSRLGGQILATTIATNWPTQIDLVSRPRLTVVDRTHPLAQLVTRLALESARPLATVHGQLRRAELPPPTLR